MAARGGIGVVLPRRTINYLLRVLGDIPIDPDRPYGPRGQTTFPYIARRMRDVREAAERFGNTMTHHEHPNLPEYRIVWTTMAGHVDYERPGGRQLFTLRRDVREWTFRNLPATRQPIVTYNEDRRRSQSERRSAGARHGASPNDHHVPQRRRREYDDGEERENQRRRLNNSRPPPYPSRAAHPNQPSTPHCTVRYNNYEVRIHPDQWGANDGDRNHEGRDYRPAQDQRAPPYEPPMRDPASPREPSCLLYTSPSPRDA